MGIYLLFIVVEEYTRGVCLSWLQFLGNPYINNTQVSVNMGHKSMSIWENYLYNRLPQFSDQSPTYFIG